MTAAGGCFITLEGIEGVGKSTLAAALASSLRALGHTVMQTREPGGTALGESIRSLCLEPRAEGMHPDTELLLMFSARNEHVQKCILPALARAEIVLCDRFTDASYAYQGGGRGVAEDRIATLERYVQGALQPDCTLLLDAPVRAAFARTQGRTQLDRFESEQTAFFERVREAYLARARRWPERIHVIDAQADAHQVHARALALVTTVLQR